MDDKELQYQRIEELVFEYQAGSSNAGLEIIRSFGYDPITKELSRYIGKYFNLLRYGVINFKDKDTRLFIRMYVSDQAVRDGLIPFYQYADIKKAARKKVQMINFRLRHLTDEEIINDLCYILLKLAKRYKKKGSKKNFCGFVYNKSFRGELKTHYKYLFEDLLYSKDIEPLEDFIDEDSEITIDDKWYLDLYFEKENQELGFNWILGRTATFPFNQLTRFERTLISLYDHKGMTYEEVGAQMGYHRDTIWSKRKQIKNKIQELLKKPPCD